MKYSALPRFVGKYSASSNHSRPCKIHKYDIIPRVNVSILIFLLSQVKSEKYNEIVLAKGIKRKLSSDEQVLIPTHYFMTTRIVQIGFTAFI